MAIHSAVCINHEGNNWFCLLVAHPTFFKLIKSTPVLLLIIMCVCVCAGKNNTVLY